MTGMILLFALALVVSISILFPKKDRTPGRKWAAFWVFCFGTFFLIEGLAIQWDREREGSKYYHTGIVTEVGSCRSADGFFAGNPGCTVIIKLEGGTTRSAFIYDGAVKGMTVYQPCEDERCDANWSNGRTLTEGHWASRK